MRSHYLVDSFMEIFDSEEERLTENRSSLDIKIPCTKSKMPEYTKLCVFIKDIPTRDSIRILISQLDSSSFTLSSDNLKTEQDYDNFINELIDSDETEVQLVINKEIIGNRISIYCLTSFCEWLFGGDILDLLPRFNGLLKEREYIIFEVFDSDDIVFSTETMLFVNSTKHITMSDFSRINQLEKCRQLSNFYSGAQYSLLPEDFHVKASNQDELFTDKFKKIEAMFSMIYLANSAYIEKQEEKSKIFINIIGQRACNFSYDLKNFPQPNDAWLYKIYSWAYNEGNPADKVEITRNILSLHCKFSHLLEIDEKTYSSIQSNYSLYQKKNVENYLNLKNKLSEFVMELNYNVDKTLIALFNRFYNNLFAFLTFTISVFLVNLAANRPINNIFSEEIKNIIYIMILGSLMFLIFSVYEINNSISRLKDRFELLKDNYRDIIDNDDLDNAFDISKFLNSTKKAKNLRNFVCLVWIVILFIILLFVWSSNPVQNN